MNDFILIPNPVTGLLRLLDSLAQMTFGEYLMGIGVIMGAIVLWGLFSMIYLAIWPDLPEPSTNTSKVRGGHGSSAEHTAEGIQ